MNQLPTAKPIYGYLSLKLRLQENKKNCRLELKRLSDLSITVPSPCPPYCLCTPVHRL